MRCDGVNVRIKLTFLNSLAFYKSQLSARLLVGEFPCWRLHKTRLYKIWCFNFEAKSV